MNVESGADWEAAFNTFFDGFGHFFPRSDSRRSAYQYLRGLLSEVPRKNGWQLAEVMGLSSPLSLQRLLDVRNTRWDAEAVTAALRQQIMDELALSPGVAVIDESGFVKKGRHSAGVARQYCGRVGKVDNCQVGVFLGYVTPSGEALLSRRLYLPRTWVEDGARRQQAGIPEAVSFRTKPQLAQDMLAQATAEGVPIQWVTGDALYGNSPTLRHFIHDQGQFYVLAVGNRHQVDLRAGQRCPLRTLHTQLAETAWVTLEHRWGEKSPLSADWQALRVRLAREPETTQWLLIRRSHHGEPQISFYLSNAPLETPLLDLVTVACARQAIEGLFREAKSELGLADYEVRTWTGWHRHMTLVMLAHTWLKLIQARHREKKSTTPVADLCAS